MAEPVYPSLEQQQEGGRKIGFEGLEGEREPEAGFSVQFTPATGGDSREQLTDEPHFRGRTAGAGQQRGNQPPGERSNAIIEGRQG